MCCRCILFELFVEILDENLFANKLTSTSFIKKLGIH